MQALPTCLCLLSAMSAGAYGPHHPRASHRHHRVTEGAKLTEDQQLLQDKEHIQEDLKELVSEDVTSKMTPEELEFYYFKVHDADNNTKLDGLEILQAIQHTSHDDDGHGLNEPEEIDRIIELIDRVLAEDDLDRDGYLSYMEYVNGRNRNDSVRENSKRH